MKKLSSIYSIFLLIIIMMSCSTEAQKINFGQENCDFCSMTIMDKQFASQIMTKTGKSHKFCSIECMVLTVNRNEIESDKIEQLYVLDYENPDTFIAVNDASFLISDNMPSPMGQNLNAFSTRTRAHHFQNKNTGTIYDWEDLLKVIK